MDINEALNEIIFKYHLDRYYPHYRKKYQAEKILKVIVQKITENHERVLFIGNDETGIEFIRYMIGKDEDIHFFCYDRNDTRLKQLETVAWEKYEKIYLISFYGAAYAERWFRLRNIQYEWIYDVFEREGICLQREFYAFGKEDLYALVVPNSIHTHRDGWTESIECELYSQRSKFESSDNSETKRIALEKCLFLSLYMRNFVEAKRFVDLLSKEDKRIESIWKEIQGLLNDIKDAVSHRPQKDIILYWMDGIPYGDESDMCYLKSVMKKSVVFENAFNYMPNTHPALRSIFLGKKDIDDRVYRISEITRENSPVIQFLEQEGYGIKVFSGYFHTSFPLQYVSSQLYMDWHETVSMKLWDMLSYMLLEDRKTLWIVHAMESHEPCLNTKMRDDNYRLYKERYRLARLEIDEQLAFYDSFVNRNSFRIYMSDHGRSEAIHSDTRLRFHILFNIYHEDMVPGKIEGLFSLLDFGTVLKQIVVDGSIKESEFLREYVEIGDLDRYSGRSIESLVKNREELPMSYYGFRGIIDKEYIYVQYKMGKEWMQKRDEIPLYNPLLFYNCATDICEPALLSKYRELVGEYPKDIEDDEKFKYSKYLYVLYHNILRHNPLLERVNIINLMIERCPDHSIGVRMGGEHSVMLYYVLSEQNKKKIWGFIDNSDKCRCKRLGLPIIRPGQNESLKEAGVKTVLLSSYTSLEALRREAEIWREDFEVLDIYAYMDKSGIQCEDNFWVVKGNDEDYDVGFPFDEKKR